MDPVQCLADASEWIEKREYHEARNCLEDYNEWRRKGGFEPPGGDVLAARLLDEVISWFEEEDEDDDYDDDDDDFPECIHCGCLTDGGCDGDGDDVCDDCLFEMEDEDE